MEDLPKNRRWVKNPQNWRFRVPTIIQLRSINTNEFIDWFEIRKSTASPVTDGVARAVGEGLFFIGGVASVGSLIGYFSGRQISPKSAWHPKNDFYLTHNDQVREEFEQSVLEILPN
jgi:hypothetical protein